MGKTRYQIFRCLSYPLFAWLYIVIIELMSFFRSVTHLENNNIFVSLWQFQNASGDNEYMSNMEVLKAISVNVAK